MTSPEPIQHDLSLPSTSSLQHTSSVRSNKPSLPPLASVIVSPPWAKDEPPSPTEKTSSSALDTHLFPAATESRPSDAASHQSNYSSLPEPPSRWWAFTAPRPREAPPLLDFPLSPVKSERKGLNFKDRSMSWLPSSAAALREGSSFSRRGGEKQENARGWNQSIAMPPAAQQPTTLSHNATPGWETPWTSRAAAQGPRRTHSRHSSYGLGEEEASEAGRKNQTVWQRRRKRLRSFILINVYAPLLFRIVNLSLTAAALGVAVRIRRLERQADAMGAVGSSPTLVIIFAPLTLVHVMIAIYLEYFGRPLGLWRTSAKLAYTLSEVLFICMWSAAVSLCFDNFFTSLVPCAPWSAISWYNELPRPPSNIPNFEGSVGDKLCEDQLALICLVSFGLTMYCTNIIISLFRIFEKVKYRPGNAMQTS